MAPGDNKSIDGFAILIEAAYSVHPGKFLGQGRIDTNGIAGDEVSWILSWPLNCISCISSGKAKIPPSLTQSMTSARRLEI